MAGDLALCNCLVVDQNMPGLSGLDLITLLRAGHFAGPAILITSRLSCRCESGPKRPVFRSLKSRCSEMRGQPPSSARDRQLGRDLASAQRLCSQCHAVQKGQSRSPNEAAPIPGYRVDSRNDRHRIISGAEYIARSMPTSCSSRMNCRYRSLARSSFDVDQSLGRELAVASCDTPTGPPAPALRGRAMDILTICPGGNFCELVPSSWHWIMPPVMFLLLLGVLGVPIAHVLHRSGRSRWWTIIAFVPLLNLIGLWVFAFSRWPKLDQAAARSADWAMERPNT